MTDLSVGVGSGSRAQLLSGSTQTAATTSSMETGSKQVKWTSDDDVVKDHQLRIENRRPWRQSNHGTVGRRCCRRMGYYRGPRVHRLNATVDVEKSFRRQSSASKRTRACFVANWGTYDVPSSTPTQARGVRQELVARSRSRTPRFSRRQEIPGQTRDPKVIDDR